VESGAEIKLKVRGRPFTKGNGGRKPGARNHATLVAAALLEGEATELIKKAIELAKDGNVAMLKMFLGPILPRERLIQIELPNPTASDHDPVETMARIITAVTEGKISPSEGAAVASLFECYRRTVEVAQLVQRIEELEAAVAKASPA